MAVAVVTGANRGIGLGLAQQLKMRGYDVVGTSRSLDDVDELSQVAQVVQADVTDDASVAALAARCDAVDLLVNNAGWVPGDWASSLAELDVANAEQMLSVNTTGAIRVTKAFASKLNDGARIVNITSRLGSIANANEELDFGYASSKAALNMFTRQLAFDPDLKRCISVAVSPGVVHTRMSPNASRTVEEATKEMVELFERLTPEHSGSYLNYDGSVISW